MRTFHIAVSRDINAPPDRVYALLADYYDGHPRILPRPPFVSLEVEKGGVGAGTVIRFEMRVGRRTRTFRAYITEPQPGRVLVETDLQRGGLTAFIVDTLDDGQRCRVTISTELPIGGGPIGMLQRYFVKRLLPPTYARELELLAGCVRENATQEQAAADGR